MKTLPYDVQRYILDFIPHICTFVHIITLPLSPRKDAPGYVDVDSFEESVELGLRVELWPFPVLLSKRCALMRRCQ